MISEDRLSKKVRAELLREAGWRCAVPGCGSPHLGFCYLDHKKSAGKNAASNLIALCLNCGYLFESKDYEDMNREELLRLKKRLVNLYLGKGVNDE